MVAALESLWHHVWLLASTYGSGSYGSSTYNGSASSGTQIGPLSLPVTGATLWVIVGIAAIAVGVGLFVWARQQRRHKAEFPSAASSAKNED
jgi:hypothetical protein